MEKLFFFLPIHTYIHFYTHTQIEIGKEPLLLASQHLNKFPCDFLALFIFSVIVKAF